MNLIMEGEAVQTFPGVVNVQLLNPIQLLNVSERVTAFTADAPRKGNLAK